MDLETGRAMKFIRAKAIVTGGAGFIGSNLCRFLLEKGNKVICLDNFFTGRQSNINDLMDDENFTIVKADIVDKIEIDDDLDEIYNLACPASPPAYQSKPIETTKTCVVGMINMLDLALENDAKILFTSTSEVYGEPLVHPQVETYRGNVNPNGIRACYDEGKRCAESLCLDYNRVYGTKVKIVRIFNTYGPHMDPEDGRVISNFILQALKGVDITIYGDGSQSRSFCYVDDMVKGLYAMMESDDDFLGPINLGNPNEFTISELAEMVVDKIKSESEVVYKDLPADDPTRRQPDINLAREKLNWEPEILLDEGLDRTIKYYSHYV